MPVISPEQIKNWDQYTIQKKNILSVDLMERAAKECVNWLKEHGYIKQKFVVFCGKGNNGGDGLAIARLLLQQKCQVSVFILEFGHKGTEDFQTNLSRLHENKVPVKFIQNKSHIPAIEPNEIVIDAILGSGLNRPVKDITAQVLEKINSSGAEVVAIDIPSGLLSDRSSLGNPIIEADHTLTFQCQKTAFLVQENAPFIGQVHILDIGLEPSYLETIKTEYEWIDASMARKLYKPRNAFSHKGNFGHALLIAGSYGKMGAAVLCARACLRSGAGLVTVHCPARGVDVIQTSVPEAMCDADRNEWVSQSLVTDISKYKVIGIGPGIGTDPLTAELLSEILSKAQGPVVLDADALNIISQNRYLLNKIPPHSVLTPHPKEFERLFGATANDFDRIHKVIEFARDLQVILVLKGHFTFIGTPGGRGLFNSTGNPGMASGGTGDVLTGIITGLIAQGYEPLEATLFGVFWHGMAGDLAAEQHSQESMIASDVVDNLGTVILSTIHSADNVDIFPD